MSVAAMKIFREPSIGLEERYKLTQQVSGSTENDFGAY